METKALFLPLIKKYFEAFEQGLKREEYRRPGGPWNERTCRPGRPMILSCGYGRQRRMAGEITSFEVRLVTDLAMAVQLDVRALYGNIPSVACIGIRLQEDTPGPDPGPGERGGDLAKKLVTRTFWLSKKAAGVLEEQKSQAAHLEELIRKAAKKGTWPDALPNIPGEVRKVLSIDKEVADLIIASGFGNSQLAEHLLVPSSRRRRDGKLTLQEARRRAGLQQQEAAASLGISVWILGNLERGTWKATPDDFEAKAEALFGYVPRLPQKPVKPVTSVMAGAVVRERRKARKLTQQELADAAGCTRVHITAVEANKRPLTEKLGKDIAKALGCALKDIFG